MRTNLDLDDEVLQAATKIAKSRETTLSPIVSELIRKALEPSDIARIRNGVPVLPRRPVGAPQPTMTLVNELRDA